MLSKRIKVIYNSLDFDAQNRIFNSLKNIDITVLRTELGLSLDRPIILCLSRLTKICYYEWLIEAAAKSSLRQLNPKIVFIGDGPMLSHLSDLARENEIDAVFLGAIYDEALLGKYIMAVDTVVSPGKVGLTAMHALAYGTPVVTHGDFDTQMPEVEAVVPGNTGAFFDCGSSKDLGRAVSDVLNWTVPLISRREICRNLIVEKYNPEVQRRLIDEAIDAVL